MRPGEFWEAMNAYSTEVSAQRRHLGELIRGATLRLWNLQVSKKDRLFDESKFWPMPWDERGGRNDEEIERLTKLSEKEAEEEAKKFFSKVKNGRF